MRPIFAGSASPSSRRGRAERRTQGASAASCASVESARVRHHESTGYIRRSARGGFVGLLRALPGGDSSALVRHRRSTLTSALRSKRVTTHRLDASDGHRDHTIWAGAQRRCQWGASPPRFAPRSVVVCTRMTAHGSPRHEGARPAADASRRTLPRPPHPAPRTVTIAKRPSHRDGIKELNPRSLNLSRRGALQDHAYGLAGGRRPLMTSVRMTHDPKSKSPASLPGFTLSVSGDLNTDSDPPCTDLPASRRCSRPGPCATR